MIRHITCVTRQSARPNGYLRGSYRIATAPEPNSSRLTSFKSTCFDSPANNVGPCPANLGCTVGGPTSHGRGSQRNVRDNVTNITTSEMLALVLWRTIWPSFKSLRS
jgi:hypothetical protein